MAAQIGDRIAAVRGKESQASFGERLGVSENTVYRYEKGGREPGADFLQRLCALRPDVNPTWLLLGDPHPMQIAAFAVRAEERRPSYSVDVDRLRAAVEAIEEVLGGEDLELAPQKKAELIVTLYELSEDEKSVQRGTVLRLVKLAR